MELKSEMIFMTYESRLPRPHPTLLHCLFLEHLGYFFRIVPPEAGARMSQPPTVTLLGPRKPFLRRMGSPGSHHGDTEPTATVLTAGSTKQSTHTTATWLAWLPGSWSHDADIAVQKDRSIRWEGTFRVSTAHRSDSLCSFHEVVRQNVLRK